MATLHELRGQYLELFRLMEEGDVDAQVLADTIEGLEGEIEEKLQNYVIIINNLDSDIEAFKKEIARMSAQVKTWENHKSWLKGNAFDMMDIMGITKIKTEFNTLSIQNNPKSVVIDELDITKIPERYLKYKEPDIDKKLLKEDIEKGEDLTGIAHIEQTRGLRIR